MEPIGYIKSCFRDKFGTPRQSGLVAESWAEISFRPDVQAEQALQGLEGFSHLWLIWIFHQNKTARYHAKVHPPRLQGKTMGVFATRTPHRPNPIGLSLVKIVKIEDGIITVAGADLVDGTPILDIKPYLPEIESIPSATWGWTGKVEKNDIVVEFNEAGESVLRGWQSWHPDKNLRAMITETLKLDPRPVIYRGYEEGQDSPYRQKHAVRLLDGDVHFHFISASRVEVFNILLEHN